MKRVKTKNNNKTKHIKTRKINKQTTTHTQKRQE